MTDLDLIAVWYLLRDDAERHRDDSAAVRYRAVTDEMRSRGFLATGEDDKSAVLAMIPSFRLRTHVQYFATPLLAILAVLPFVMTADLLRNAVVPVDVWFAGLLAFFCLLGMLAAWCAARVNFQGVTADGEGRGDRQPVR